MRTTARSPFLMLGALVFLGSFLMPRARNTELPRGVPLSPPPPVVQAPAGATEPDALSKSLSSTARLEANGDDVGAAADKEKQLRVLTKNAPEMFKQVGEKGLLIRAEGELRTLKSAVLAYWIRNGNKYPADIHATLVDTVGEMLPKPLTDPFDSDPVNHTYGYVLGSDPTFGDYFAIFTRGPAGDSTPEWDAAAQKFTFKGSGQVVSNAPVARH